MTSLLRDLALEKEDFSEIQSQETLIVGEEEVGEGEVRYKEKYEELLMKYEQLEVTHHKTLGDVTILKDTINTLKEDISELKKRIDRQKEQELMFQEVEENNADLREECEKHVQALKELQECHTDLENSLSESSGQVHALLVEKKNQQENLQRKDEIIARLEKELCDIDKAKVSNQGEKLSVKTDSTVESNSETSDTSESSESGKVLGLSLEEQIQDLQECTRRSSSRLSYLNTRLAAKDDMIAKLQNRVEEVIAERDSFREALQMSFVSHDEKTVNSPQAVARSTSDSAVILANDFNSPASTSSEVTVKEDDNRVGDKESVKLSSPSSPEKQIVDLSRGETETKSSPTLSNSVVPKKNTPNTTPESNAPPSKSPPSSGGTSVLGNWAAATGLTTDGLKGVTSSWGSYLYTPGNGNPNLSGLSYHHKQYISNLEKKVRSLQEKCKKLLELKALIPVVEDLKDKLQTAENTAKETDKWADEEFATLSKKIEELKELRKEAIIKCQQSQDEVQNLKEQIARTATTYSNFEAKLQDKVRHIQILEKELRSTKDNSVDLAVHDEAQNLINNLQGEAKHWQQKAQSLSKEMHRSMTVQQDYNRKKDEILKLEKKIEELEVERQSFRQAMQDMMLSQSDLELKYADTKNLEQQPKKSLQFTKSWLGNLI